MCFGNRYNGEICCIDFFCFLIGQISCFFPYTKGRTLSLLKLEVKRMQLIIYTADCTGNAKNCKYPHRAIVINADELQTAVSRDHVCAEYQGNYRSVDNFISSNGVVMDQN